MKTILDEILMGEYHPFLKLHQFNCECIQCNKLSKIITPLNEVLSEIEFESNWTGLEKAKRLNYCMKNWLGWGGTTEEKNKYEKKIKRFLVSENHYIEDYYPNDTQGNFAMAVREFQVHNNLYPDGIIGESTLAYFSDILNLGLDIGPTPISPSWIKIADPQSPYFESRRGKDITHIIYHATGGGGDAVRYFQNNSKRVSPHFVVAKDGTITQMIPLNLAAKHAGASNDRQSIGIEIVNWGHILRKNNKYTITKSDGTKEPRKCNHKYCSAYGAEYTATPVETLSSDYKKRHTRNVIWDAYTPQQYASLINLTLYLASCNHSIKNVTGHEQIVSDTKRSDPGGAFNWNYIKTELEQKWKKEINTIFPLTILSDKNQI